jgi:uncharacterized protein with gpF-like domain
MKKNKNDKVLDGVFPNAGIEAAYRQAIMRLVDEMQNSYVYWLTRSYKSEMAQDASIAFAMRAAMQELIKRWQKKFNQAAPKLADWFTQSAATRSDKQLQHILRKGGISVRFKMTKKQLGIVQASVVENVALIKSIPQKYHTAIVPMVMDAVKHGRKLDDLTKQLQKNYKITRNRAILIAKDQNNKATAALVAARQNELGLQAIWLHSGGGRHPRPTHVANSGKPYDPVKGWYDPHEKRFVWPGTLINCRCVSKTVVPGFT